MYIIGVDDKRSITIMLERILEKLDPGGVHRFYNDPLEVLDDLDEPLEVAFLDIEMPRLDGIELAKRITARYPLCNIIFLTGTGNYMQPAFDMHASGYILKPFTEKKIEDALSHLRYRTASAEVKPVRVQCFGCFEVFVNGEPVKFKRSKSKEMLAYLIDRRGALCNMDMMIGNIEPDSLPDETTKSKIRVYIGDLIFTFFKHGIDNIIIKSGGSFAVNTRLLECDYYRYLKGDPYAISLYAGEYMTQYSFAEETRGFLEMKYYDERKSRTENL